MSKQQQTEGYAKEVYSIDLDNDIPFYDEVEYLSEINKKLENALHKAGLNVERMDNEYRDAKRYMAQFRGEIDPREMFQNELAIKQIDSSGAFAVGMRDKFSKLKESPYFARIDFQAEDSETAQKYYIGRLAMIMSCLFVIGVHLLLVCFMIVKLVRWFMKHR